MGDREEKEEEVVCSSSDVDQLKLSRYVRSAQGPPAKFGDKGFFVSKCAFPD